MKESKYPIYEALKKNILKKLQKNNLIKIGKRLNISMRLGLMSLTIITVISND